MPTVASLPAASSVSSIDAVPVSQVNGDGSITLRRATPAQFNAAGTPVQVPSVSTLGSTTIVETVNGVVQTTTIAPGLITTVYGAPINQTWRTTIISDVVTTTRTA
jgi:hypothetical protein